MGHFSIGDHEPPRSAQVDLSLVFDTLRQGTGQERNSAPPGFLTRSRLLLRQKLRLNFRSESMRLWIKGQRREPPISKIPRRVVSQVLRPEHETELPASVPHAVDLASRKTVFLHERRENRRR